MEFKTEPYPHQLQAFDKLKDLQYSALLADMGTGKSKVAIDICAYKHLNQSIDRVLIIAPNAVHPQWIDEQFPTHCPVAWRGFSYSSKNTLKFIRAMDTFLLESKHNSTLSVFTMNIEAFARPKGLAYARQFINTSYKPPVIIVDEASRIKNPSAKTVKNIKLLRDAYLESTRMILTGTPAAKSPVDMWSIFDFLKKKFMGCSYVAFSHEHAIMIKFKLRVQNRLVSVDKPIDPKTYAIIHKLIDGGTKDGKLDPYVVSNIRNRFGMTEQDFWQVAGSQGFARHKNIKALQRKIAPITFSAAKKDCLNLPDKIYERITFDLNSEQKKLIKDLVKYSAAVYDKHELTVEVKALLGVRVLQICGGFFSHHTDIDGKFESKQIKGKNAKLDYVKHNLKEIGSQQFMVWAVFSPEIQLLKQTLEEDFAVGVLDGSTPKDERAEVVNDFKKGFLQGLISHPEVGGYGLNLQGAGVQYWYSRNYRTEARLQAEDRSHRIGITKSPIYKDLLYNVRFEHLVLESLQEGQELNDNFMTKDINELFSLN